MLWLSSPMSHAVRCIPVGNYGSAGGRGSRADLWTSRWLSTTSSSGTPASAPSRTATHVVTSLGYSACEWGIQMDDLQQLPDEDLWSRLADAEGRDRLEILFELGGRASRRGVYDRATTLWQEAQAVAEQLDDYRMAAEALRLQGAAAFYSEDYPAAIHLYREAAHGHEQAGQTREAAGALWCLADAFRALGDSEGDPVPAPTSSGRSMRPRRRSLTGWSSGSIPWTTSSSPSVTRISGRCPTSSHYETCAIPRLSPRPAPPHRAPR